MVQRGSTLPQADARVELTQSGGATRHAPPRQATMRRAKVRSEIARTIPTAPAQSRAVRRPVASGVNPPEERPSVSAATLHRCGAGPRGTAMRARARRPSKAAFSAQRSAFTLLRALHARDGGVRSGASRALSVAATHGVRMGDAMPMKTLSEAEAFIRRAGAR